jgi:hypothetical protein
MVVVVVSVRQPRVFVPPTFVFLATSASETTPPLSCFPSHSSQKTHPRFRSPPTWSFIVTSFVAETSCSHCESKLPSCAVALCDSL